MSCSNIYIVMIVVGAAIFGIAIFLDIGAGGDPIHCRHCIGRLPTSIDI